MHRFFVPPEALLGEPVRLEGDLAHQIARVLRLHRGEHIELLDGSGWAYEAALEGVGSRLAVARVLSRSRPETEPRARIVLYQALPKRRRFDLILQKGTELGVSTFVPMLTRYAEARAEHGAGKTQRWARIVAEAVEQSGRARVPVVRPVVAFGEACQPPPEGVLALMPYVGERERGLADALGTLREPPEEVRLYVGPEGGFAAEEAALAAGRGIRPITLGPRVLRTETAALTAVTVVLYALGELGPARREPTPSADA